MKDAVKVLSELDEVELAVYTEKVSKISGLSEERIASAVQAEPGVTVDDDENAYIEKKPELPATDPLYFAEVFILSSMIYGKEYVKIGEIVSDFFLTEGHSAVFEYLMFCAEKSTRPVASRVYDLTEKEDADQIIEQIDAVKAENQSSYYLQCIDRIKKGYFDRKIKETMALISSEQDGEKKQELKQQLIELTRNRNK